jgi:hypothetical protein
MAPWAVRGGGDQLVEMSSMFRDSIGEIFLADGLVQCRTDSAEILSEMRLFFFALAGAHLIWVSEVIRFCILPETTVLCGADRVTFKEKLEPRCRRCLSPVSLGFFSSSGWDTNHPCRYLTADETLCVVL